MQLIAVVCLKLPYFHSTNVNEKKIIERLTGLRFWDRSWSLGPVNLLTVNIPNYEDSQILHISVRIMTAVNDDIQLLSCKTSVHIIQNLTVQNDHQHVILIFLIDKQLQY